MPQPNENIIETAKSHGDQYAIKLINCFDPLLQSFGYQGQYMPNYITDPPYLLYKGTLPTNQDYTVRIDNYFSTFQVLISKVDEKKPPTPTQKLVVIFLQVLAVILSPLILVVLGIAQSTGIISKRPTGKQQPHKLKFLFFAPKKFYLNEAAHLWEPGTRLPWKVPSGSDEAVMRQYHDFMQRNLGPLLRGETWLKRNMAS
jgi:hypothetical protein